MIILERREKIVSILKERRAAGIKELAREVFTSEASVRRDVAALEAEGIVRRSYGGVMLESYKNSVVPLELRDGENSAVKEELARRAAALVSDGDTLMLDASSTVRRIVKYLGGKRNLTIITNNARILSECDDPEIKLYSCGGAYSRSAHAFVGAMAERFIAEVNADILFFSSQALSEDGEISDSSEEETAIRRVMLKRAPRRVFLCDSGKLFERRSFVLCRTDEVTDVICDKELPFL